MFCQKRDYFSCSPGIHLNCAGTGQNLRWREYSEAILRRILITFLRKIFVVLFKRQTSWNKRIFQRENIAHCVNSFFLLRSFSQIKINFLQKGQENFPLWDKVSCINKLVSPFSWLCANIFHRFDFCAVDSGCVIWVPSEPPSPFSPLDDKPGLYAHTLAERCWFEKNVVLQTALRTKRVSIHAFIFFSPSC